MTGTPLREDTPVPAGTDASAWQGQIEKPWKVELSPGRPIWCHTPPFLELLSQGVIPNELEHFILYEDFDGNPQKVVRGQIQKKTDVELSVEQAERWKNKLRIAARAMDWPKLRLKGTPNYAQGEAGPADLTPNEINDIAFIAVRRALPPLPAIFPEPATAEPAGVELSTDVRPGEPVPHTAEHVDGTDGG